MPRKEGKTNKQTLSKAAKLVRLFILCTFTNHGENNLQNSTTFFGGIF